MTQDCKFLKPAKAIHSGLTSKLAQKTSRHVYYSIFWGLHNIGTLTIKEIAE